MPFDDMLGFAALVAAASALAWLMTRPSTAPAPVKVYASGDGSVLVVADISRRQAEAYERDGWTVNRGDGSVRAVKDVRPVLPQAA